MKERHHNFESATSREFDLVIIGGGITGAGIAQNAACRGMSVLLIEKNDFASGASGKTNQLINGSVPYLEQLQFSIMRKHDEEAARLQRTAPHLVKEVSFILPFARNNTFLNIKASVGQTFYDLLRMCARGNAQAFLSKSKLLERVPALSASQVEGGIQFFDAITDDARLVLSVLKAAAQNGAVVLNYVQACGVRVDGGQAVGVNCRDRYSGKEFLVSGRVCVNATGAWINELLADGQTAAKNGIFRKSTQIVVPGSAFETNSGVVLPAEDGRYVTVVPWHHALLIGRAESEFSGLPDDARSTQAEVDYLLQAVNRFTQSHRLSISDVKAVFTAPFAPSLRDGDNESAGYTLLQAQSGLYAVSGGRLSDYRLRAEEVMEKIVANHPLLSKRLSNTQRHLLGGWSGKEEFIAGSASIEIKGKRLSINPASIEHLLSNYGCEAEHVVDLIEQQPALNQRIIPDFPPLMAEVAFAVVSEMAVSLQDVFFRRTRLAMLNRRQSLEAAPRVAELMGKLLGWDAYRTKAELSALESELFDHQQEAGALSL